MLIYGVCNSRTHEPADRDSRLVPALRRFVPPRAIRCACLLLLLAAPAAGQGIRGRVLEDGGRSAVREAEVEIVSADGRWSGSGVTDSTGFFRVQTPRADVYRITVRHVAYQPWTSDTIRLGTAETVSLEIRLGRTALPIEPLVVTARSHPRLAEFDERRLNRTFGRFLTREDIEARGTNRTSELFRTIPGIQLVPVVRRNRTTSSGNMVAMRGGLGTCSPSIFIDGLSARQYPESTIDDMLSPSHIEGVEVYTSATTAPPRYNEGTGCGVILFWTRAGTDEDGRPWNWKRVAAGVAALGLIILLVR